MATAGCFSWSAAAHLHGAPPSPARSAMTGLTPVLGSAAPAGAPGGGAAVPYAGPERALGLGEAFGELSFFTEIPQMTTVRCASFSLGGSRAAARARRDAWCK